MSKLITELWYGNVLPVSDLGKNNSEMRTLLNRLNQNRQNLDNSLNDEQIALLNEYCDTRSNYDALSEEQAFCNGFSIAVKILTEALSHSERIT